MKKYILTEWPESQNWLEHPECHLAAGECESERFFEPMVFVPEEVYNKVMNYENSDKGTSN